MMELEDKETAQMIEAKQARKAAPSAPTSSDFGLQAASERDVKKVGDLPTF